jgi:Dopey, N-terminal
MGQQSLADRKEPRDPVFKRYSAVVDRALAAFDSIVEWPDYIAFLGKLLKVFLRL